MCVYTDCFFFTFKIDVPVNVAAVEALGIHCVMADPDPNSEEPKYNAALLQTVLDKIIRNIL